MLREGQAWLDGASGRVMLIISAVSVATALICRCAHKGCYAFFGVVSVSLCASFVLASCVLRGGEGFSESLLHSAISDWELRVASDPLERNEGYRCRATAMRPDGPSGDVWLSLDERLPVGTTLRCAGRYAKNGDDEWGVSARMQGVWGSVRSFRILDTRAPQGVLGVLGALREAVVASIDPASSSERALLAGCVSGARGGLVSFGIDKTFARCGSSHLIAVSGSHMAVLSTLVAALCGMAHLSRRWSVAAMMTLNGLFVLLCCAPISAVRAWIMTTSAMAAGLFGRRSHAISGASMAGLVMVLVDPTASGQLGFLLSITAVLGLSLFSSYATYAIRSVVGSHRPPRFVPKRLLGKLYALSTGACEGIGASVVAQLSTLPVSLESFDEVSLVGPAANAALSIPFTLMVGCGMVAALLWWAPAAQGAALVVCDAIARVVLWLAQSFSSIPLCTVNLGETRGLVSGVAVALAIALLVLWPRVSRRKVGLVAVALACLALGILCRWRFFAPARVCVLDVGQGDAILVQEGAHALLVDTGPDDAIASALARNHVMHLDAILITHLHADHYAGIEHLVGHVSCDRVYVAAGVASRMGVDLRGRCRELTGKDVAEVGYGDVMGVEGFALRMVWPLSEVAGDVNADSVELVLSYDDGTRSLRGLLTGDAERDETGSVIAKGDVGDVDFLKVGHHGSQESLTGEEAQALDPEVSVASAGEGNSYGHPAERCVDTLEGVGSTFLCTKDVGDVEIRPGERGPVVSCGRRGDAMGARRCR